MNIIMTYFYKALTEDNSVHKCTAQREEPWLQAPPEPHRTAYRFESRVDESA
jgi:hypothetical protein